ncbi:MAG: hypothetical protein ACTSX0_13990 [Promethearchaeota archaeon]
MIFTPTFPLNECSIQTWGLLAYLGVGTTTIPIILQSKAQK